VKIGRLYSKHTSKWIGTKIKEAKTYSYIPILNERIVKARLKDTESIGRKIGLMEDDPRAIQPTIAPMPAPPTAEVKKTMHEFARM
jgi:hypothetical protein